MAGRCAAGLGILVGTALLLTASSPVAGQAKQEVRRLKRVRQIAEGFTRVTSLVPIGENDILVVDGGDAAIWRLNLSSSGMERFSRPGEGPGEYRAPGRAFSVSPESTYIFDEAQKRLSLLGRSLSFVRSYSFPRIASFRLRGLDRSGNVYYEEAPERFQPATLSALQAGRRPSIRNLDSIPVIRVSLLSGFVDTSGWVQLPPRKRDRQSLITEGPGAFSDRLPFGEQDDWSVSPTGLIAIVRGHDYSVVWLRGNRELARSPSITTQRVQVTDAEKDGYWNAFRNDSMPMLNCSTKPCRVTQVFRPQRPTEWPETKNPFEPRRMVFDPGDRLWIKRAGRIGDAVTLYDVVGPDGFHTSVGLESGRTILAVTQRGVFAVWEDGDGLQYLEQYALPAF